MSRFVVVVLFCVAACSKSKPKDEAAGSAAAPVVVADAAIADAPVVVDAAAAEGSAADGDAMPEMEFDKLSHEEQVKFMKTKVNPPMKAAFQKFDPKDYAKFGCKTCHGKDPQKSKYKMPNPDLKPLDFAAIKAGKEDPKMIEFMSKTVKPQMAKIMGVPEMTETNPKGFGCLACHTMKK
jgi:hypothetical protein